MAFARQRKPRNRWLRSPEHPAKRTRVIGASTLLQKIHGTCALGYIKDTKARTERIANRSTFPDRDVGWSNNGLTVF
jgi:hypothetical protein